MIGYLRGKVEYLLTSCCLLDVQGVGYRVFISDTTRRSLLLKDDTMLFTHMSVRDDAIQLYGFATQAEYDIFQLLISVSGIGPKVAIGILSAITVDGLCRAIQGKQISLLTKLPGIGKKSAERLVLELKDKIALPEGDEPDAAIAENIDFESDMMTEASAALQSLGYSLAEIVPVLKRGKNCKQVEDLIKFALREFAGRN